VVPLAAALTTCTSGLFKMLQVFWPITGSVTYVRSVFIQGKGSLPVPAPQGLALGSFLQAHWAILCCIQYVAPVPWWLWWLCADRQTKEGSQLFVIAPLILWRQMNKWMTKAVVQIQIYIKLWLLSCVCTYVPVSRFCNWNSRQCSSNSTRSPIMCMIMS
jgi:hypothetical protein